MQLLIHAKDLDLVLLILVKKGRWARWYYIDGLVQDCSISSALAMEILKSCIKPSIYGVNICDSDIRCQKHHE